MKLGTKSALFLLGVLGVAVGCGLNGSEDESEQDESEIRELERRLVGPAKAYPAEKYTEADAEKYAKSKKARRELGWHVLAKALQPVKIAAKVAVTPPPADPTAPATAPEVPPAPISGTATPIKKTTPKIRPTVPLFRTWMGGDEIERIFAKMYGDLGKERRLAKDIPTATEIKAVFDWNTKSLGPSSEADYYERLQQLGSQQTIDGLGGNARVSYSPGYVQQYLNDYPAMAGCEGKLEKLSLETPPISEDKNFTNCFSHEMAIDAAVIKASWRRNDELINDGLPVVDTSAAALKARVVDGATDKGGWNLKNLPLSKAGPKDAYSVTLSDETGYSLVGLHVMTKELRHWVWVTVWWSPSENADNDFGQDRPEEIKKLGAPWSNYKMCVVTDFDEKDPDPRGGFTGSLGDALAAVHSKASWCSNSFIEKGEHNAQTNCIGCHQHAGDINQLANVLTDGTKYPFTGRQQVRKGFPADYSWAFATPASPDQKDRLFDVIVNRMKVYAREDQQ